MSTAHDHRVRTRPEIVAGDPATRALQSRPAPSRAAWMDGLRIVAILAVITIHTVSPLTAGAAVPRFSASWWIAATMNVASLWCVPVFIMISGALLLDPTRPRQPVKAFYRRRLQRIGVPLVFWTVLYLALRPTLFGEHLSWSHVIRDVAAGHPFLQMYYLYVIAGLYVVAPFLQDLVRRCTNRQLTMVAVAVLALNIGDAMLSGFTSVGGTNALTEWIPFLGYFVAGAWLMRRWPSRRTGTYAGATVVAAVAVTVVATAGLIAQFGWSSRGRILLGYQSPTVVVLSLAVFWAARTWALRRNGSPRPALARIGTATFGVFLVHPLFLVPLVEHWGRPRTPLGVVVGVPLIVAGVAVASLLLTFAMERVPGARRLVS
jgi:surface polysaccharide O-acyltransferase-like enzyme